jgi:hypothetical protein
MSKALILLFSIFAILIPSGAWAQHGEKNISLGYEFTGGIGGELTYGFNVGFGYELEKDNEFRVELLYQKYEGTTWDASKDLWPSLGRSVSDAEASLLALIVGLRGYIFAEDLGLEKIRPYFFLGGGYYISTWDDIHPNEGKATSWGVAPGIGVEAMITKHLGLGLDVKQHIMLKTSTANNSESFTSGTLNAVYRW